jgi:hypothetical protein
MVQRNPKRKERSPTMKLYASNATISRSARRHARLNKPMDLFDLTPRLTATKRTYPPTIAPTLSAVRRSLVGLVKTLRALSS